MARQKDSKSKVKLGTPIKEGGVRGPMTAEHKKKIGLALKRKWKARKSTERQAVQIKLPAMPADAVSQEIYFTPAAIIAKAAVQEARPKTIMAIISEIDLTMAALNRLHRELDDLIGD